MKLNFRVSLLFIFICSSEVILSQSGLDYVDLAFQSYKSSKHKEAINYATKAINSDNSDFRPYYIRGLAKYVLENYSSSEEDMLSAISLYKSGAKKDKKILSELYMSIALIKVKLGKNTDALNYADEAVKMDTKNATLYVNRADIEVQDGQPTKALKDYDKAIQLEGTSLQYFKRALLNDELKRVSESISDYTKAIELDPKDPTNYNNRGWVYFMNGDNQSALKDLNLALEVDPNCHFAYDSRGDIKRALKDYKGAINDYTSAIKIESTNADYYFHYGRALFEQGELESSIKQMNSALSIQSNHVEALLIRAEAKMKMDNLSSARIDINKVLNLDAGNQKARELESLFSSVKYFISNYVDSKMKLWQVKGEFEKSTEYIARLSDQNRIQKIKEFSTEGFTEYKKRYLRGIKLNSFKLENYDADNESFKLTHKELGEIFIHVPVNEAPEFKESFYYCTFNNPDFMIKDDKLILSSIEISYYKKLYKYDITKSAGYNPQSFTLNLTSIQVDLSNLYYKESTTLNKQENIQTLGPPDVDMDIPKGRQISNKNYFAVIIGIEKYKTAGINVSFAERDAKIVESYFKQTLGIPEENFYIRINSDATYGEFNKTFEGWLQKRVDSSSTVFVYYAGHGAPSEDQNAYLIPYDGDPNYTKQNGYSLEKLYQNLIGLRAKQSIIFLDACFSGQSRDNKQLLTDARAIGIKVKDPSYNEKLTIFSATDGNQISSGWPQKSHGLFTYYFLKGLRGDSDSNGDKIVTISELGEYIKKNVAKTAGTLDREQTPQLKTSNPDFILCEF